MIDAGNDTGPVQDPVIRTVAAGRGYQWLMQGSDLFARQPLRLLLIGLLSQLILGLIQVPVLNILIAVGVPIIFAGVYVAIAAAHRGQAPYFQYFFQPLRKPLMRTRLLLFGLINLGFAVLWVLLVWSDLAALADSGFLESLLNADPAAELPQIDPATFAVLGRFFIKTALYFMLYSFAIWFVVPLIVFSGLAPVNAIKISVIAVLRNWAALTVYGLSLLVIGLAALLLLGLVQLVLGALATSPGISGLLATLVFVPASIFIQMLIYCAKYLAFTEVFSVDVETEETPGQWRA